jgi:hypothetical protein
MVSANTVDPNGFLATDAHTTSVNLMVSEGEDRPADEQIQELTNQEKRTPATTHTE